MASFLDVGDLSSDESDDNVEWATHSDGVQTKTERENPTTGSLVVEPKLNGSHVSFDGKLIQRLSHHQFGNNAPSSFVPIQHAPVLSPSSINVLQLQTAHVNSPPPPPPPPPVTAAPNGLNVEGVPHSTNAHNQRRLEDASNGHAPKRQKAQRHWHIVLQSESPMASSQAWAVPPRIHSVLASAEIGCSVNLRQCARHIPNFEYPPPNGTGGQLRVRNPKATVLIHGNGKMTLMGMPTRAAAQVALRKCARKVQKVSGHEAAKFQNFDVSCLSGTASLPFEVLLEEFSDAHMGQALYEPEIDGISNQAMSYTMAEPPVTFSVFHTGTVNARAKTREDFYSGMEKIFPLAKMFERKVQPTSDLMMVGTQFQAYHSGGRI
eukprot:823656_1